MLTLRDDRQRLPGPRGGHVEMHPELPDYFVRVHAAAATTALVAAQHHLSVATGNGEVGEGLVLRHEGPFTVGVSFHIQKGT